MGRALCLPMPRTDLFRLPPVISASHLWGRTSFRKHLSFSATAPLVKMPLLSGQTFWGGKRQMTEHFYMGQTDGLVMVGWFMGLTMLSLCCYVYLLKSPCCLPPSSLSLPAPLRRTFSLTACHRLPLFFCLFSHFLLFSLFLYFFMTSFSQNMCVYAPCHAVTNMCVFHSFSSLFLCFLHACLPSLYLLWKDDAGRSRHCCCCSVVTVEVVSGGGETVGQGQDFVHHPSFLFSSLCIS